MKKTLAAMAVLGAFAGSAFAADVTVYGVVDLGLNYQHQKVGDADATDKLTQYSGQNSGSRFGLKPEFPSRFRFYTESEPLPTSLISVSCS